MRTVSTIALTLGVLVLGVALFIWSGRYDMGADAPHWPATQSLITALRDRSIAAHST